MVETREATNNDFRKLQNYDDLLTPRVFETLFMQNMLKPFLGLCTIAL